MCDLLILREQEKQLLESFAQPFYSYLNSIILAKCIGMNSKNTLTVVFRAYKNADNSVDSCHF